MSQFSEGISSRVCFGCPGYPPGFLPEDGLGGARFTDGGLDELPEFLFSRSSRSAILASSD